MWTAVYLEIIYIYIYIEYPRVSNVRHRRIAPALRSISAMCSLLLPRCSLNAPSLLPSAPPQPFPSLQLVMLPYKFKRERSFSLFWILIREEPVIAPPIAHCIIFCSCPFNLSLLIFPFYIARPLPLFALYVSVARAFLSCYNSRPNLDSTDTEKEDCSAVL